MSRKQQVLEDASEAAWLMTYADLMTLLLVFFVLLFSISSVEKDKFEQVVNAFQLEFQGELAANSLIELSVIAPSTTETPQPDEIDLKHTSDKTADSEKGDQAGAKTETQLTTTPVSATDLSEWDLMVKQLEAAVESAALAEHTTVDAPKDGVIKVVVDGSVFFEVGSAQITQRIDPFINVLLDTMYTNRNFKMRIQGHTDDTPINTIQFPSNWELSAVRATTVLRYLVRGGVEPDRLAATGYGDSVPLVPNDSAANRARNRRIEFVLERVTDD
jgi:chemotaxis protein MotB